jgi:hypothetical protein
MTRVASAVALLAAGGDEDGYGWAGLPLVWAARAEPLKLSQNGWLPRAKGRPLRDSTQAASRLEVRTGRRIPRLLLIGADRPVLNGPPRSGSAGTKPPPGRLGPEVAVRGAARPAGCSLATPSRGLFSATVIDNLAGDERTGRMEDRLVPINAILDLATPDLLNPAALAEAGWEVRAAEVPVNVPDGRVVIDLVLFHPSSGRLLVIECKSGANIEEDQAAKLIQLTPELVVDAASVTVSSEAPLSVTVAYACLAEHETRIRLGLETAGIPVPVLAVTTDQVTLMNRAHAPVELADALPEPVRFTHPIAARIPFDHDSPPEAIKPAVQAEIVAAMAQDLPSISITTLAEQVMPHLPMYARAAQQRFFRKVREVARGAADTDESGRLRFEPDSSSHAARVVIAASPERHDRRGRTQAYQALFTDRKPPRRRAPGEVPGQADLFAELDAAEQGMDEDEAERTLDGIDETPDQMTSAGEGEQK